ncbi:MAG: hypothetical protein ACRD1T_13990 [Acidimicrobiia bacterium]
MSPSYFISTGTTPDLEGLSAEIEFGSGAWGRIYSDASQRLMIDFLLSQSEVVTTDLEMLQFSLNRARALARESVNRDRETLRDTEAREGDSITVTTIRGKSAGAEIKVGEKPWARVYVQGDRVLISFPAGGRLRQKRLELDELEQALYEAQSMLK